MADEKKKVNAKTDASETSKTEKKAKKPVKFSPKNIGKAIAHFFKDLRGETKKIVWPTRQMILKSTGIVLAAILVIGAGIWIIDFALAGAVGAVDKLANQTTTEAVSETEAASEEENASEHDHEHDHDHDDVEETTEATTAA